MNAPHERHNDPRPPSRRRPCHAGRRSSWAAPSSCRGSTARRSRSRCRPWRHRSIPSRCASTWRSVPICSATPSSFRPAPGSPTGSARAAPSARRSGCSPSRLCFAAWPRTSASSCLRAFFQGIGGALMIPVGRLVLLRSVPREELVRAIALFTTPALIGPVLGSPLGGLIVQVASWHWIFFVNLPIGAIGIAATLRQIPDPAEPASRHVRPARLPAAWDRAFGRDLRAVRARRFAAPWRPWACSWSRA